MANTSWIVIVYTLGLAAMILELFIPGAVIGISGFCMVVGAIIYAASTGQTILATVLMALILIFLPFFFLLWKNVLGRMFSVSETLRDFRSSQEQYEELLGEKGSAMSSLRPSGSALIQGKRYNVVTRGEMIDKDTRIEIIDVKGSRLVVKRAGHEQ